MENSKAAARDEAVTPQDPLHDQLYVLLILILYDRFLSDICHVSLSVLPNYRPLVEAKAQIIKRADSLSLITSLIRLSSDGSESVPGRSP